MTPLRAILLVFAFGIGFASSASAATYWHFTFKAFVDPDDNSAAEWAWVTLVEMPKERAFPEEAAAVRRHGGRLQGTIFAFVRGAAWRSAHRFTRDTRCKGRPAVKEISWNASDSRSVHAGGQLNADGTFQFSFTTGRVLMEDATWTDPQSSENVFVGPIRTPGEPEVEMRGGFQLYGVNYEDTLEHHSRCGKTWVEQYRPAFYHFQVQRWRSDLPEGEDNTFEQISWGHRNRKLIVASAEVSSSREHPHWKRQEM